MTKVVDVTFEITKRLKESASYKETASITRVFSCFSLGGKPAAMLQASLWRYPCGEGLREAPAKSEEESKPVKT